MLAMDRNLVVVSEKWGHGRRLVIHDTGSFAKGLNSKLDALEEGGSLSLASNMSNIEMKLVQATAAKMGLVVSTSKDEKGEEIVKVFKMSDYKAEVRDKLINVDVGKRCFLQNLAEEECAVVHQVASELGLRSMESAGDSEGTRNIVIFSSTEYVAEQAVRMGHVADGGQAEFFVPQTSAQRQAFWDLADKNGMCLDTSYHGTKGQEDFRSGDVVRLTKCLGDSSSATDEENPGDLQGGVDFLAERRGPLPVPDPEPAIPSSSHLIQQAFDAYATGSHSGERTFLRFVDLKAFATDMGEQLPQRKRSAFAEFSAVLENCFDDTAQLQSDIGIRMGSGLTQKFFQVFIQKAMHRLGLQVASVLFEVLNQHT